MMHTKKVNRECVCDKHSHDANDNINKMENISNKKKFQQENGVRRETQKERGRKTKSAEEMEGELSALAKAKREKPSNF